MLLKNKLLNIKKSLGNDNVLANLEERYCYSTDASNNFHKVKIPDLVVFVETIEDVQNVLKYANQNKIPVVSRGAGTNMVGACVCDRGGIVLNFSKMNKILEINPVSMYAKVQPGVVLGNLKDEVEKFNLFYPPDPSNYRVSTIGGSIAQSSGGAQSFKYGTTKDYIMSLTIVTADGKLLKLGTDTQKDSMGYHLNQLFVGSEGTLGVVVEATLKLIPKPELSATFVIGFEKIENLISVVDKIIMSNIFPAAIDFMDRNSIVASESFDKFEFASQINYLLFLQLDGDFNSLNYQKEKTLCVINSPEILFYEFSMEPMRIEELWNIRRVSYSSTTKLAPDVISDDLIVPRDKVELLINKCNMIVKKYNLKMCLVGHIGNGNLHPQIALDTSNESEYRNYMDAKSELYDYVIKLGGSISAEHGVGLDKLNYLENIIDKDVIEYMRMIKRVFDPNNILNPGKIFIQE